MRWTIRRYSRITATNCHAKLLQDTSSASAINTHVAPCVSIFWSGTAHVSSHVLRLYCIAFIKCCALALTVAYLATMTNCHLVEPLWPRITRRKLMGAHATGWSSVYFFTSIPLFIQPALIA
ncbi:hypothetical protein F4777DRAFT_66329 [Nemania sp. FL0916]|nr:hypothetical protein F4777DRAFT_66329 [Nemania sp. FL0916]